MVRDGVLVRLRPGVYAPAATVTALVRNARDDRARQSGGQLLRVTATLVVRVGMIGVRNNAANHSRRCQMLLSL